MTAWTNTDLASIGDATELTIQPKRADGSLRAPLPIWVVREGDDVYIRSYKGDGAAWYRAAKASSAGHISAGGVDADVEFTPVADPATNDRVDAAYSTKYRSYGASYIGPMTAPTARATTLKLTPR